MTEIYLDLMLNRPGWVSVFFELGESSGGRKSDTRMVKKRYCQLKSDWAVFLPWAGNLNA